MIAEAVMGLSALKSAFDLAKGVKDISDASTRNHVSIELQEKILAAQQSQGALVERLSVLEKELAKFERWEAQSARYQLQKLQPSTFLYALRQGTEGDEPPHYICPKCYEHRMRSILHGSGNEGGLEAFDCHECKSTFHVGKLHGW